MFSSGEYSLVPIRSEDRYNIMKWRNEQMYHLRQKELITEEKQDLYFNSTVLKLFEQDKPNQILFSFLKEEECIGYGGLVHINWLDKNAEISFIMDTTLEKNDFNTNWTTFLNILETVAWDELQLHKIYTYAFDLRPKIYNVLEAKGFVQEARLKEHTLYNGVFIDVVIHSKIQKDDLNK